MNQKLVDTVVHAVLYEGYILYPYRASAKKNRQRFTFGRVYPETYSVAENNMEPCSVQTQCLIDGPPAAKLEVIVRFLHPMARDIGALAAPLRKLPPPDNPDFFHVVPELEIDGKHYSSWQEAVERAVHLPVDSLFMLRGQTLSFPFNFTATRSIEPIHDAHQHIAGVIVRRQESVTGSVELTVDPLENNISRITVRIVNRTAVPSEVLDDANEIVMRTFASTHTILHAQGAEFPSIIDPPEALTQAAADCRNIGTWPILVGDPRTNERDTLVSSPIILYDYPEIAPESPGNLFDSGEIDEILTLRIMTMTDEEKREMRNVDEQARRILERTEAMPAEDLLKLHGVMRGSRSLDEEAFFNPATRPETVSINGVALRKGDLVRVRPKSRADIMDIAVAGKIAVIESIEQDAENNMHLALVLEDDPGKDLGMARQPGHRFFYSADEVEPVEAA